MILRKRNRRGQPIIAEGPAQVTVGRGPGDLIEVLRITCGDFTIVLDAAETQRLTKGLKK